MGGREENDPGGACFWEGEGIDWADFLCGNRITLPITLKSRSYDYGTIRLERSCGMRRCLGRGLWIGLPI